MFRRQSFRATVWLSVAVASLLAIVAAQPLDAQGGTWVQSTGAAPWAGRGGHESVAFGGKIWLFGGLDYSYQQDVWSSTDGASWNLESTTPGWSARYEHASAVLNGRIWLLGGFDGSSLNDVWSTSDGINWTLETASAAWSGRSYHSAASFGGKLWVLGGIDGSGNVLNDVWSSTDGINWIQETASAAWGGRYGQALTVFNNKLWLAGGDDLYTTQFNDVWSSTDGINWSPESLGAAWSVRGFHSLVTFNSRLWLIAGGSGVVNSEVWYSTDGMSWQQDSQASPWAARSAHTSVVFADGIWILGGFDASSNFLSDVWKYTVPPKVTSTPPLTATVGAPYSYAITVEGVPTPTIQVAGLPAWLPLTGAQLAGTPALADIGLTGTITVTASSSTGSDVQSFEIDVQGIAPAFTSSPVVNAQVGMAYTYTVVCTGTPDPLLFAGTLPDWMHFNATTRELYGTPSPADVGTSPPISIAAINGWNPYAVQTFQITVMPAAPGSSSKSSSDGEDGSCSSGQSSAPMITLLIALLGLAVFMRLGRSRQC